MSKSYDIIERLKAKNERPFIRIDEEHCYTVNTSKTTVMAIMAIADDQGDKDPKKQYEAIGRMLFMALGKEAIEYIDSLDLSFDSYNFVFETVMAALTGADLEDPVGKK